MTTMQRLANINVECMTLEDLIAMGEDALNALFEKLQVKMLHHTATKTEEEVYFDIEYYYERQYYYDNIDAFREYQSHMNEPDFDWDFYSDWHKDMYGFRPR